MRVLLDTCVVSEIRRSEGHPRVRSAVLDVSSEDLFLSVLTVGELVKGIAQLDSGRRKSDLETWLNGLQSQFSGHILRIDAEIAILWGEITALARLQGRTVPAVDGLIAATALRHGLSLMTRNVQDFEATGVRLINPWTAPGVHDE